MRGLFANKDRLLTPGLFVRIRLPWAARITALLVSDRAIDTDQGQKILYVVNRAQHCRETPGEIGACMTACAKSNRA